MNNSIVYTIIIRYNETILIDGSNTRIRKCCTYKFNDDRLANDFMISTINSINTNSRMSLISTDLKYSNYNIIGSYNI